MNKRELSLLIESDLTRYGIKSWSKTLYAVKRELYGFKFTKVLRKTKYHKENQNYLRYYFNRLYLEFLTFKYGFQIPYSTNIGKGLYIAHFGRVIVNYKCIIGNNVNLSPGVTLGIANRGEKIGVPIIGNDVWIGTNAVVVGGIKIGNDVMIAPNSFVNFDVPDHSIVVGNPGVIHSRNNATECYIENKVKY